MPIEVGNALLKWVYTDQCDILQNSNDGFLLDLMRAAGKYKLSPLVARFEKRFLYFKFYNRITLGSMLETQKIERNFQFKST